MNINDLDDLFKRAADDYPLRTDSADWDKVARALDEDDDPLAATPLFYSGENKSRRKLLWLLLLLPFAAIGYYTWNTHSSTMLHDITATTKKAAQVKEDRDTKSLSEKAFQGKEQNKSQPVVEAVQGNKKATANLPVENSVSETIPANYNKKIVQVMAIAPPNHSLAGTVNKTRISTSGTLPEKTKQDRRNNVSHLKNKKGAGGWNNGEAVNEEFAVAQNTRMNLERISLYEGVSFDISSYENNLKNPVVGILKPGSVSADHKPAASKKKNAKHPFFYAGITVAPDLSTIKFQTIKGNGYTAGVLLGYSISSKIAIETGVYYDLKKYYSQGEYFSKKNVPQLNYVNLLSVNGSCDMIEVPLNLRYNVFTQKKTKWFATTGLSTYFMFRDGYNYRIVGNNGIPADKYYSYNKSSQNWFSVINFSAGYEHNIGKIGNLRLEPYLRIPLAGMGTGSLPIMSAGLNIGITHRIN